MRPGGKETVLFFQERIVNGTVLRYQLSETGGFREISVLAIEPSGKQLRSVLYDLSESKALCLGFVLCLHQTKSDPRVLYELWEEYPK